MYAQLYWRCSLRLTYMTFYSCLGIAIYSLLLL